MFLYRTLIFLKEDKEALLSLLRPNTLVSEELAKKEAKKIKRCLNS